MADKEATVFIIDLGQSMGRKCHGRDTSDLDWSLRWLEDKLTNIVYMGRKTLAVGVLGLGTDDTINAMQDEDEYEHISELQKLQPMVLQDLRGIASKLRPSKTTHKDAMSAIIIAIDMLTKFCGKLKWKKKVILITDGTGSINPDDADISSTADQIKEQGIELLMLGLDFDDPEYGYKEEDKPAMKAKNEKTLQALAERSGGRLATMAEAIEGLAIPYVKPVRPTPTFKGKICLGDLENYDTAISIDVERYFKVAVKRPPTASSFAVRDNVSGDGLQTIMSGGVYQVPDPSQPNGLKELDRDELAKGYEYGRTAVHIAESDENITKLETEMSYLILGFIPKENVERYMLLDNTNMLVASKGNDKAGFAISSLVRALYEIDSVAIARLVKKDMSDPQLTLLTPFIDEEIECLIENILPFAEDIRQYRFPPLDKVVTVSGKTLASHRNLPSDELMSTMDSLVDEMTLGEGDNNITIDETYSPANFSIENAIKFRAVHTGGPTPSVPEGLMALSIQQEAIQERSRAVLARLIETADVKKVPPKVKGRRRYREAEKPLSGLNVDDLFKKEDKVKISADNAIPEFKQALSRTDDLKTVVNLAADMSSIIRERVRQSFGDDYDRPIAELGEMRQELIEYEFPEIYNKAIRDLKQEVLSERLGGNRRMFWYRIKIGKLGLVDNSQSEASKVTSDEAKEFLDSR